ncbi:MAG: hypothetical protein P8104_12325, partial [Gammaproteobacteria bacterium]
MPKPVNGVGTPFKPIVIGIESTTASHPPRSKNKSIHRFAQGITEIRESSSRARAGHRTSGSYSETASMRSSSASSYRMRRQKGDSGSGSGSNKSWSIDGYVKNTVDWLFNPEPDLPQYEPWSESSDVKDESSEPKDEPSASTDEPSASTDEPSASTDEPSASKDESPGEAAGPSKKI